jgi:serine/threonine protein kinase/Tfp pilus assembly protein PilF
MECPKCEFENPKDMSFCVKCGTQLSLEEVSLAETKTLLKHRQELETGSTFAGRYQVVEEMGRGGMGRVYKVIDTKLKEELALKVIHPEIAVDERIIKRFGNELKMARKISHKNVCRMYHLEEDEGIHYITMEFIRGESLKDMIGMMGQLSPGQALSVVKQVCEGLAEAHKLGVVHRDLKPSNIMIDREGNARIMDFGIARSLKAKGITRTGTMIGTPEYMSPEQVEGLETDQRSDLYSLGVILYEMATGRIPFDGDTPFSIALKHKSEKPQNPKEVNPQIPENLSRLIMNCLEKDREKRYQTAEELLAELGKIEEGIPTEERVIPRRRATVSREITVTFNLKKVLIPVLAIVALAVIAVFIFQLGSKKEVVPVPSDKPSLAVLYFKNNTGDDRLDHWRSALSDLLITDLSQSKHIKILSAERLFNILNQLDQLGASTYSSEVLKEVAAQGGVGSVLVGNYTRANDTFRINVTLQEASSGELIGSESVEGHGEKDFYAMVDELTRRIKTNFELSETQIATDIDKEVGKITTDSPEAYKHYSQGRTFHLNGDYPRSVESMLKAVEIDPEFAMAYRSMASAYGNMGWLGPRRKARQKAFELRHRVSDKERFLIEGDYYWTSEKTLNKAIEAFRGLLELYPDESIAINNLGGVYSNLEEWDRALELYKIRFQEKPVNYIVYSNIIEIYMVKGMYDIAKQVVMSALNDYPDHEGFYERLALIHTCLGEYDSALNEVEKAISLSRRIGSFSLKGDIFSLKENFSEAENAYKKYFGSIATAEGFAKLYLLQGKLEELSAMLERGKALQTPLAHLYLKTGEFDKALRGFDEMLNDAVKNESITGQILILYQKGLAYLGLKSASDAQRTAEQLRNVIQESSFKKAIRYHQHLLGMIELERENYPKAVDYFQKAVALLPPTRDGRREFNALFINPLAQAYYKAGDLEKALGEYKRIASLTYSRIWDGDIYAKSFYMMGMIYERMGKKAESIENYRRFLELWKDADPSIPEVIDAKKRLEAI